MAALLPEVTQALQGQPLTHLYATTPRTFVLTFARHLRLVISCERQLERFHLAGHSYPNHNTPFARTLETALLGSQLQQIELAQNDRILRLQFSSQCLVAELIPGRANLLLLGAKSTIQAALVPHAQSHYSPPSSPDYTPGKVPSLTSKEVEQGAEFYRAQLQARALSRRQVKSLKQRLGKLQARLHDAQQWEEEFHKAELLQANYSQLKRGMSAITLEDWTLEGQPVTIELQVDLTPKEQVAGRFKKARSLKLSVPHLSKQVEIREQELTQALMRQQTIEEATHLEQLPSELRSPERSDPRKNQRLPFRRYQASNGAEIFVGRSAEENDRLTFQFAHGSDWWLHAHDVPGAHVVLRVPRGTTPSQEALEDALHIAAHHSRASQESIVQITVTQVKWLTRPKGGRAGKVWVSEHKVMTVRPNPERIKQLQLSSARSRNR